MKIIELKLFTNQLEKQKEFFLKLMEFELFDENNNEFCIKIGWSKLRFIKSETIHTYHYCFLIPSNKLLESLEWINIKTKTIEIENGKRIIHFEDWNADSFYFFDGGGNIAEFIVRHDLKNKTNAEFDLNLVLCINEIGLGTNDIEKVNKQLEEKIGTKFYKGNLNRFGTNGSAEGIFLIPNYNLKETWFPTEIKIKPEPFECIIENNSKKYNVIYRDGELTTSKVDNYQTNYIQNEI